MSRLLTCVVLGICVYAYSPPALAQDSKLVLSVGVGMGFNQGRTADFADTSGNITAGAGYNFGSSVTTLLEYQYYNLEVKDAVAEQAGADDSVARLESVSANLIVRPVKKAGLYGIAGLGWYRRLIDLRGPSPAVEMSSDSSWGMNAGGGVEFPIGGKLKMFGELRYHHVYNSRIPTQVFPVTFGFRW